MTYPVLISNEMCMAFVVYCFAIMVVINLVAMSPSRAPMSKYRRRSVRWRARHWRRDEMMLVYDRELDHFLEEQSS